MTSEGTLYADEITEGVHDLVRWAQSVPPERLYEQPPDQEWTAMENLVHVVEFLPYWAEQVDRVVSRPGEQFGRTHDDANRAQWISQHREDNLDAVLGALDVAATDAAQVLRRLPADAWRATGVHANRGEMTLAEIVEFFITDHLRDHADQAKRASAGSST